MDESRPNAGQGEELGAEGMTIICDRTWDTPYFNKPELSVEGDVYSEVLGWLYHHRKGRKYKNCYMIHILEWSG